MEMDDEVAGTGNQYDYGFRIYNPRIAKFLSVDPLAASFPWLSPYQFAGNTPVWAIDIDGLETYIVVRQLTEEKGKTKVKVYTVEETSSGALVHTHMRPEKDRRDVAVYTVDATGNTVEVKDLDDLPKNYEKVIQEGRKKEFRGIGLVRGDDGTEMFDADKFIINRYASEISKTSKTVFGKAPSGLMFYKPGEGGKKLESNKSIADLSMSQIKTLGRLQAENINKSIADMEATKPSGAVNKDYQVTITYSKLMTPKQFKVFKAAVESAATRRDIKIDFKPGTLKKDNYLSDQNSKVSATQHTTKME